MAVRLELVNVWPVLEWPGFLVVDEGVRWLQVMRAVSRQVSSKWWVWEVSRLAMHGGRLRIVCEPVGLWAAWFMAFEGVVGA
ncbi:hypothetical protein ACWCP6_19460 [Streptomyces sp. NPDC002004]